jgi:hypothetical protein
MQNNTLRTTEGFTPTGMPRACSAAKTRTLGIAGFGNCDDGFTNVATAPYATTIVWSANERLPMTTVDLHHRRPPDSAP